MGEYQATTVRRSPLEWHRHCALQDLRTRSLSDYKREIYHAGFKTQELRATKLSRQRIMSQIPFGQPMKIQMQNQNSLLL